MSEYFPVIFINEISINLIEKSYKAVLCLCNFSDCPEYYKDAVIHFHPMEKQYFNSLKYEKRIRDYTAGRYTAKLAVAAFTGEKKLDSILIKSGLFNQPVVYCSEEKNIQVSITHCDCIAMAAAFPEDCPLGIDLERINEKNLNIMEKQLTPDENRLLKEFLPDYAYMAAVFWTAKESISKVLRTGLFTPMEVFEINKIQPEGNGFICGFRNFPQCKAYSVRKGNYVFSIAYPSCVKISINLNSLGKGLGFEEDFAFVESFKDGVYDGKRLQCTYFKA